MTDNKMVEVALEDAREGDWAEFEFQPDAGDPWVKVEGEVYTTEFSCWVGGVVLDGESVRNLKVTRTVPPLPTEVGVRIIVTHRGGVELTWPYILTRVRVAGLSGPVARYKWESADDYYTGEEITGWLPFPSDTPPE